MPHNCDIIILKVQVMFKDDKLWENDNSRNGIRNGNYIAKWYKRTIVSFMMLTVMEIMIAIIVIVIAMIHKKDKTNMLSQKELDTWSVSV